MWSWAFAFAKAFYVSGAKAGQSTAQGESVNHGAMQKRIRGGIQPNKRGRAIHRVMQKRAQEGIRPSRGERVIHGEIRKWAWASSRLEEGGFVLSLNVNTEFQDAL